jgi:hypothetical protein
MVPGIFLWKMITIYSYTDVTRSLKERALIVGAQNLLVKKLI